MSSQKNLYSKNDSFLSKSNSSFIEQMYLKFINKDSDLPQSWRDYFQNLDEEKNLIIKEINGPSWQRNKKINENINVNKYEEIVVEKIIHKKKENFNKNLEQTHRDSVRAVTLIRAYRTQGNLLAKLDPLGLKTSEYIDELHPEYHGFKKKSMIIKFF